MFIGYYIFPSSMPKNSFFLAACLLVCVGIFSPIDPIVTPLTRYKPITTASTCDTTLSFPHGNTRMLTSTTATNTASSKSMPALSHTPHARDITTDSSGIFSPLESCTAATRPPQSRLASSWLPTASPLLVSRMQPAAATNAESVVDHVTERGFQREGLPPFTGVLIENGSGLSHQRLEYVEDANSGW